MIVLNELVLLILLLVLLRSESFLNHFKLIPRPRKSSFELVNSPGNADFEDEARMAKRDLFIKGLELWNEHFSALKQWESVKPSKSVIKAEAIFGSDSINEIVEGFKKDSWLLLLFPMIPDLIVDRTIKGNYAFDFEILIDFFCKRRLYRQLASLIALNEPQITSDDFKAPSLNDLIYILEFLFKLKPEKVEEFFGEIGNDKLFLVAPLIACSEYDFDIVKNILGEFARVKDLSKNQFIAQICSGILLTEVKNEELLFSRNEKLISHLPKLFNNPSPYLSTMIKACHIMNLIKFKSSSQQRILSEIYLDETEESVNLLFEILLKVARTDFQKKMIESYRYPL